MTANLLHVHPTLRWAAALPSALLAVALMQWVALFIAGRTLALFVSPGADWFVWAAKSITCPFMGAVFVLVAAAMAPARRRLVAMVATMLVVVWGLSLGLRGADVWGAVMGGSGVAGALATYLVVRRRAG